MTITRDRVQLDYPSSDGGTLRGHVNSLVKAGLPMPTEINGIPVPNLEPVLSGYEEWIVIHFNKLDDARAQGANGPSHITYRDLKDYQEVMEETLSRFECETVMAMDSAYISEFYKQQELNLPS